MALATMVAVAAVVAATGIAAGSASATAGRAPSTALTYTSAKKYCPPQPKGGYQKNPRFSLPAPPPHSKVVIPSLEAGCTYIAGYSDVAKLSGAALVTGLVNLSVEARIAYNQKANYFQEDTYGQPLYQGQDALPPVTATFLSFGFAPTTATIILTQIGTLNNVAVGPYSVVGCHHGCQTQTTISQQLSLRLAGVSVNGVPLPVGNHCQTVTPFTSVLHGSTATKPPYTVTGGGPLHGVLNIPGFAHCGIGENLDPLFDGTVSGKHNYNLITQGAVCFLIGHQGCPPVMPTPLRTYIP